MPYRVSLGRRGEPYWWVDGAVVPSDHTDIRPAKLDEAQIMDRICKVGFNLADSASLMALLRARVPVDETRRAGAKAEAG